jgi:hypothetical protein
MSNLWQTIQHRLQINSQMHQMQSKTQKVMVRNKNQDTKPFWRFIRTSLNNILCARDGNATNYNSFSHP